MKLGVCEEPVREVLNNQLKAGGIDMTFEELAQQGFYKVPMRRASAPPLARSSSTRRASNRWAMRLFRTTSSRPESPLATPGVAKEFPLVLTTGARIPFFFNSEHRQLPVLRKARREPRAEIMVVSRGGGARVRRVEVERQCADRQRPALRPADGDLSAAGAPVSCGARGGASRGIMTRANPRSHPQAFANSWSLRTKRRSRPPTTVRHPCDARARRESANWQAWRGCRRTQGQPCAPQSLRC